MNHDNEVHVKEHANLVPSVRLVRKVGLVPCIFKVGLVLRHITSPKVAVYPDTTIV